MESAIQDDAAAASWSYRKRWLSMRINSRHSSRGPRFFRAGYNANLTSAWLTAFTGVVDELKRGALAADVGYGHGASTVLMAKTRPKVAI